jgi:hypothetical protein
MKPILLLLLLAVFPALFINAQNKPHIPGNMSLNAGLRFEENKGQFSAIGEKTNNQILYVLKDRGMTVFFTPQGVTYQWQYHKQKNSKAAKMLPGDVPDPKALGKLYTEHAEMKWLKANPNVQVSGEDAYTDVNNYYQPNTMVTGVKSYHKITYKNLYPNTDVVYYIKNGKLEYDVVLKPGSDIGKVRFAYNGHAAMRVDKGKLKMSNSLGTLTEEQPIAFVNSKPLAANYTHANNQVSFNVECSDELINKTIVIDPSITWGTYYGGGAEDVGRSTAVDGAGNVYVAGYTKSTSAIATAGSQQSGGGGEFNYDAMLVKFDKDGNRLWATYYGGTSSDLGMGVTTDNANNVIMVGYTMSAGMATPGTAQDALAGDFDAFVVKFTPAGIRNWATYYGGPVNAFGIVSGEDVAFGVATDNSGNIYFTGYTYSQNFPVKSATPYQDKLAGNYDAFVAKLTSGGGASFSTYYGGSGNDEGHGIAVNNGRVFVTGFTTSPNKIAHGNSHQSTYGGGGYKDIFLAAFTIGGGLEWATYYGANTADDEGQGVAVDSEGNVYMAGSAVSTGLATVGSYKSNIGGLSDAILAKFSATGDRIWATYFGGLGNDAANAISIDASDNIYIGGSTRSATGIASEGFKDTHAGGVDGMAAKFTKAGALQWGSYLGGSGDDVVYGVSTGGTQVYLAGSTTSTSGIASGGAQFAYGGGQSDAFLLNINGTNNVVVPPDPKNASNIVFSDVQSDRVTLTWTNGTGTSRIVAARTADATFPNPMDAAIYPNNNVYGLGYPMDDNTKVVYRGSGNSVTVTGLTANTTYYFKVFDYTGQFESQVVYLRENREGNPASITIGKTQQTITFAGPITKTYGDADFSPATSSSDLPITYTSDNTSAVSILAGKLHITGFGSANITASQAGNTTYGAATPVTRAVVVNKATLTFRALDNTKVYGQPNPELLPGITGFVNGESTHVIAEWPTLSTTATTTSPVGDYPITLTGGRANNYEFAYVPGTLSITKKILTVTADNKSKEQGNANPPFTITYTGFITGEGVGNLTTPASTTTTATTASPVGGYPIIPAGAASPNYRFNYVNGTLNVIQGLLAQTITFAPFADEPVTATDFFADGSASSGLPVSYVSSNTSVATIVNGNMIHIVGLGTTTITASQAGNGEYKPAPDVARTLTVVKASQGIVFNNIGKRSFGAADFSPVISASSGLPITLASDNPAVATIVGGKIHIVGAGSANITASQAGNAIYNAAIPVTKLLAVTSALQTITFSIIATKYLNSPDFDPGATSSSGLPVTYTSSNTAVATIVDGMVHIRGAGTTDITARQPGNTNYSAAQNITRILTVSSTLPQTITFAAMADKTYGDADFDPGATASSDLPVVYSSDNSSVAIIVAGKVHISGAGTANITASQPGNGTYAAATTFTRVLTVGRATLTLQPYDQERGYGGENTSFSIKIMGLVNGDTESALVVYPETHTTATPESPVGTYPITLTGGSAPNYTMAYLPGTMTITQARQSITFNPIPAKAINVADFNPGATASSGLAVTYTSSNEAVATIVEGKIHLVGLGITQITASQAGNSNVVAAEPVIRELTVTKAKQVITFATIPGKPFGAPDFSLAARSNLGLPITYSSSNEAVAKILGDKIHITGVGITTITAMQAGNEVTLPAADKTRQLKVIRGSQVITFPSLAQKLVSAPDFEPGATTNSGLPITYASNNTSVATIVAGKIHILRAGTVKITAMQAGNINYKPAANVSRTLSILARTNQTITFAAITSKQYGVADFTPVVSANSGLPVTLTSNNTAVATIVDGKIHLVGIGTASITASQPGNESIAAAPSVTRTFSVNKATQAITFAAIPIKKITDGDFTISATSSSGLAVTLTSSDPTIATITNGMVHMLRAAAVTITASQAGNTFYKAATPVSRSLAIRLNNQTITFAELPAKKVNDTDFDIGATSSAGLTISYTSSNTAVATITGGNRIHIVGAGTSVIMASQTGNATTVAANPVERTLTVTKLPQTITFAVIPDMKVGRTFTLAATSNSGLAVQYTVDDAVKASITGSTLTALQRGTVSITATQPGNATYLPAANVTRTVVITLDANVIPNNVLTPNGDGHNDTWIVQNIEGFPDNNVTISDRSAGSILGPGI